MGMWHDVGHMSNLSIELAQKRIWERRSSFSGLCVRKEREREKKEIQTFLFDLQSFVNRNLLGKEGKFIYSTRATCGYRKHGISSRIQVRSSGNQRFRV